jgi:hypothetical protein
MTSPKPDDRRDAHFDSAWRAASREEPSAELDAAIRAAARREVGAGPKRAEAITPATRVPEATRPERWWWPLAAAATIGAIAFGLLQLRPLENGGGGTVSDMPGPPTPRTRTETTRAQEAPAPSAPRPVAAPATAAEAFPGLEKRPEADVRTDAQPRSTPSAPAPAVKAASDATKYERAAAPGVARELESRPVAEWIALIRRLRDESRNDEAAKELAAFRNAYPDHEQRLPPDLRDWRPPEK